MEGQASFFLKLILLIVSLGVLVFSITLYKTYYISVEKNRNQADFKIEVINTLQNLISNRECLSFEGKKGVLDINKITLFQKKYQNTQPFCGEPFDFNYNVKIIQFPNEISFLPQKEKIITSLAWIPNSGYGNSVSLVSDKGKEIERHYTVLNGMFGNPSRTAVDSKGNVWVGNRGTNTLVEFAYNKTFCIDRNGDGKIESSFDRNGDGIVEKSEMVPIDKDECLLHQVRLDNNVRAVCIDNNDNVYAGCWDSKRFYYINSTTGKVVKSWSLPLNPYGCAVDNNGIVWISTDGEGHLLRLNTSSNKITQSKDYKWVYGIWPCPSGNCVAFTTFSDCGVILVNSTTLNPIWSYVNCSLLEEARGVFVDKDNYVYAVATSTNKIVKIKDGKLINYATTCNQPTGVSMDGKGDLWVICLDGGVKIFDRNLNTISDFKIPGSHYGYSDFTGYLTGAEIIKSNFYKKRIVKIKRMEWSFGIKEFSPLKDIQNRLVLSEPVTIRYNSTFSTEGIIEIYAVKGVVEKFYDEIENICRLIENDPARRIKVEDFYSFSFPVEIKNNNICMLSSCKKILCKYGVENVKFSKGSHIIKFEYLPNERKIKIMG